MSAYLDYNGGGEALYTGDVGPQNDGTFGTPGSAVQPMPVDAGGGPPANYGSAVLDIFKFGVSTWTSRQNSQDLIDLRKWEATNAGLFQQGQAAAMYGRPGQIGMLGIAAAGLLILLLMKKG
ncbi:hypothetical protein [Simplicispira suum]|uniref:Uncharacterized protein n=1 Tax=Simplicispira suum TaxID=2109915 RepID=A0A2S0N459_9BURK|nr:hypothetical protein [Simplicispira suum]AVO42731.1 hypothetical protein C6571_16800 [Simplicispira suum]